MSHSTFTHMTPDMKAAFPDADYVVAVKLGAGPQQTPDFSVYASDYFTKLTTTDLTGMTTTPVGTSYVLRPGGQELLRTINPDTTTSYCSNVPYWYWVAFTVTSE
jgi:hypothetical protein